MGRLAAGFLVCWLGGCASAITVGQTVAVLREPDGFHARERMYLHEEIHRTQYRELGTWQMLAVYSFSGTQRLEMEAEAYAAELCYVTRVGIGPPGAWRRGFVEALRSYAAPWGLSRAAAEGYLARAYRDGDTCTALLGRAGRQWVFTAYPKRWRIKQRAFE